MYDQRIQRREFFMGGMAGVVSTVAASTVAGGVAEKKRPSVDCDFPGGNILVERIEGDDVYLHQDQRDTPGFWFYWYVRVRGAAGRKLTFHFTQGNVIGARGPAVSVDGGRTWSWLGMEPVRGASFTYVFPEKVEEVRFCLAVPYLEANLNEFLARYAVRDADGD